MLNLKQYIERRNDTTNNNMVLIYVMEKGYWDDRGFQKPTRYTIIRQGGKETLFSTSHPISLRYKVCCCCCSFAYSLVRLDLFLWLVVNPLREILWVFFDKDYTFNNFVCVFHWSLRVVWVSGLGVIFWKDWTIWLPR